MRNDKKLNMPQGISSQEITPDQKSGIRVKNGKFFVFADSKGELEVPVEIGEKIQFALSLESKLDNDSIEMTVLEEKLHAAFNCHKMILYLLGLLSEEKILDKDEMKKRYAIQILEDNEYKSYYNQENFESEVNTILGNSLGVVQQVNQSKYGNGLIVMHSFLCGVDTSNQVICFEKVNKGNGAPFQVIPLDKLHEKGSLYGIVKLEGINKGKLSSVMDSYVESENPSVKEELAIAERWLDEMHKGKKGYPIDGTLKEKHFFGFEQLNR
jgi:hypothetical protein